MVMYQSDSREISEPTAATLYSDDLMIRSPDEPAAQAIGAIWLQPRRLNEPDLPLRCHTPSQFGIWWIADSR